MIKIQDIYTIDEEAFNRMPIDYFSGHQLHKVVNFMVKNKAEGIYFETKHRERDAINGVVERVLTMNLLTETEIIELNDLANDFPEIKERMKDILRLK